MDPLVSIIVPIYNEEKNIKRNIESLLNQKYSNIEILVIDDMSSDESMKILSRYTNDSRINIFYNEKNMGTSYSRNVGLDNAKGKYVIFVDGDDWAEDDYVSIMVEEAEKENLDMVQVNYIKEEVDRSIPQKHFKVKKEAYKGKEDIFINISAIVSNNTVDEHFFSLIRSVSGKIFKRSIIEKKEKIRFKEDLVVSENTIFTMEYMQRVRKIKYLQKYLMHFRKDKDSIRESYIENIEKDAKHSIKYMKKLIKEAKVNLELTKENRKQLDEAFAYFVFERIFWVYKLKINREESSFDEKEKKRKLLEIIYKNNLYKYIKQLDKKSLNEIDAKFLKYIKNAVFLRRFRII